MGFLPGEFDALMVNDPAGSHVTESILVTKKKCLESGSPFRVYFIYIYNN